MRPNHGTIIPRQLLLFVCTTILLFPDLHKCLVRVVDAFHVPLRSSCVEYHLLRRKIPINVGIKSKSKNNDIHSTYRSYGYETQYPLNTASTSRCKIGSVKMLSILYGRIDREMEESAERKAIQNARGGGGETAAGAILGGLVLGPFGALFGASIGSSLGAKNAISKAKKEELERMGITEDMLQSAREVGVALERATEGLQATQSSLQTQQSFAKRLDQEVSQLYQQAKEAMTNGEEERARDLLFKRQQLQNNKLVKVLKTCADERKRVTVMQENVRALEERALEVEILLKRSMGAKAMLDSGVSASSSLNLSLPDEDPLLQRFRDMGID